ncbi:MULTISPECIES: VIT domain-containing protein [unclassified Limnothrix]|uniref:VIT domain-containing protein n=1 Tax=unclassified Limnothrix TaxID=2632864 RepID=UPI001F548A9B|nr:MULTISPECIES: VIT domain-containing protein [unclassified Limnothrix]
MSKQMTAIKWMVVLAAGGVMVQSSAPVMARSMPKTDAMAAITRPTVAPAAQLTQRMSPEGRPMVSPQPDRPVGGLYAPNPDGSIDRFVLDKTEVTAQVTGNLSRVTVQQTFTNPFDRPLEAVYVFPLPENAAVDDMEIRIGDRVIKGDLKTREEARQIYEQARQEGRTAGLLEQERDNIFTQSLANIRPGEAIQVTIQYTESLKFEGGDYEFVFPMVVGPRYNPGNPIGPNGSTDQVPDGSRINPPVLPPGSRSGHDISLRLSIDAGVPIEAVRSPSHKIDFTGKGRFTAVQLSPADSIPNKDFILRYRVAGANTQASVLTQGDDRGGFFGLYLIPAIGYPQRAIVPKDVVFLMDTSGSQQGQPLAKSKELMRRFINGLNPNDTFTIIDFANAATRLSDRPLANTAANRQRALGYIEALQANGGTNLQAGIDEVLRFPAAEAGRLRSVVLLTDGYIGNDREVIASVQRNLKPGNRLFSFGVGSSVNRFLLDRLAEVGRGTLQVVRQDETTEAPVEKFFRQIANPVLTEVRVRWEGPGPGPDLYPAAAPDLFAAQPLVIFGRKADRAPGTLIVTGRTAGSQPFEQRFKVEFSQSDRPAIAQLWARSRIKDLMNQLYGNEVKSLIDRVVETSLAYRVLSQYTAFVAVSEEVRVNPDGSTQRVTVPVELPEGTSYEGFFGASDRSEAARSVGAPPRPTGGRSGLQPAPLPIAPPPPAGEVEGDLTSPLPTAPTVQIASAPGLDQRAIEQLTQYLKRNLPANLRGTFVVTLTLERGSVVGVVWDDTVSSALTPEQAAQFRQVLLRWANAPTNLRSLQLQVELR